MKLKLFLFGLFISSFGFSQDIKYARAILDTLCSPSFDGRGYFNNGEKRAAEYQSGDWFYYNELSLADIMLIPQIYNALKFDFEMTNYPRLMKIYYSALTHKAFNLALPENNKPI